MRNVIHLFYSTMLLIMAFSVSAVETDYAKVLVSMPITIGETVDVSASFEGISPGAIKLGLGESQLNGTANYVDLGQNKTRVTITWHTLKVQAGNFVENEALSPSLFSKVITDSNIDPNTSMTITGDLAKVLESFKKAKGRAESKNSGTSSFSENNINNDEDEPVKVSDLSPSSTSGTTGSGTGGDTGSTDSTTSPTNDLTPTTALQSTETLSCAPRIDELNNIVFKQEKTVTSAGGEVLSSTACADTEISAPIVTTADSCGYQIVSETLFLEKRKYATLEGSNIDVTVCTLDQTDPQPTVPKRQDCGVLASETDNLVYLKYMEVGSVDGKDVEVTSCTVDTASSLPINRTFVDCGVRHDFIAGEAIQQEKLSYEEDQIVKALNGGDCSDSSIIYPHFLTDQTCDVTVDNVTGTVFIEQRVAYNNASGQIEYAGECAPISTNTVKVETEYCPDKYEHDFLNNVSYTRVRSYYMHPSEGKVMLTECQRSTTDSFPHIFNSASCQTINDDVNLTTTHQRERSINTTDDGVMVISGCEPYGSPVQYVPLSNSYIQTYELKKTQSLSASGGLVSCPPGNYLVCDFDSAMVKFNLTKVSGVTPRTEQVINSYCESGGGYMEYGTSCIVYETNQDHYLKYLRGDGTYFDKLIEKLTKIAG